MEKTSYLQLIVFAYYSRGFLAAVIELDFHGSCNSTASFDYLIFTSDDTGLSNCTVHYGIQERYSSVRLANDKWYKYLNKSGTIKVGQLLEGLNYTLQVTCGDVSSRSIDFSADNTYCDYSSDLVRTSEIPVVEFKDDTSFFGRRDSVLGVVFGLFGILIIVVSLFYTVLRIRRRQRRERIRRYLGSQIDPFENLPNLVSQDNGSERLIESTES